MAKLYPSIKPNRSFYLKVDDIHEIHAEESGNSEGVAVVYVHGGPGSGSEPFQRRLFDPQKYRIVLFDQRGCGKSKPHAELRNNTTQDLIEDMESIREYLNIDKWIVSGGSWGSTLSLVYAQTYPERVLGLIVRGIFLSTQKELDWLYKAGAGRFYPEYWKTFVEHIPTEERADLLQAYHRRLIGENELLRMKSAKIWANWEARISTLLPSKSRVAHSSDPHIAISVARIEADYFVNGCYLDEGQLLKNIDRIAHIPGYIIHGRYDMVCLMEQAYNLHKAWSGSKLFVVRAAGHSVTEPGICSALIQAGERMLVELQ